MLNEHRCFFRAAHPEERIADFVCVENHQTEPFVLRMSYIG
jgi:hypothetical protein